MADKSESWINANLRLFLIEESGPTFLFPVGVRAVFPRQKRALIYGKLPGGRTLPQLVEGKTVEIVCRCAGPPSQYVKENVIIRLSHCHVRADWIDHPVQIWHDDTQVLTLYVSIDCEVEILGDS